MRKISLHQTTSQLNCGKEYHFDDEIVYAFDNVFDDETLRSFHSYKVTKREESIPVPYQEHLPRQAWTLDIKDPISPIDDEDMSVLLKVINKLCNTNFKHISASLWEDYTGYQIDKHVDNKSFVAALQIYLPTYGEKMKQQNNKLLEDTGTQFYHNNPESVVSIPFIPNTGYLCTNSQKIFHSSGKPVPEGLTRSSIYFILK